MLVEGEKMDDFCVICKKKDGKLSKVMSKGFSSLLQCSKQRQDEEILNYLRKKIKSDSKETTQIHNECRKSHTNKRRVNQTKSTRRKSRRGI